MTINWDAFLDRQQINLADCLVYRHVREGRGTNTALVYQGKALSYADLQSSVSRSANLLRTLGIGPNDTVLLVVPDTPCFVSTFYAILALGAVVVLANPLLPAQDLAFMATHARAKLAIAHESIAERTNEMAQAGVSVLLCGDGADKPGLLEQDAAGLPDQFVPVATSADNIAYVLFSSGTTGEPKGIPRRHRDILHCAKAFGAEILQMQSGDLLLAVPKLTFGYALGGALLFAGVVGAGAVIFSQRSTAAAVAQQIEQNRPTVFLGTPRIIAELLKTSPIDLFESLRIATSAGESLPPSVLRDWQARLSIPLLDGFGSTEVGHIFLSNAPGEARENSCGRSLSAFRVKLIDDQGQTVRAGAQGRMCIAGPSVATHYLHDSDRSAKAFDGEWHVSSDLFTCKDGAYTYVGRADDMIKKGCGEWVSPYEIEDELLKFQGVLECAVVGSRTPKGVIGLKAFIVLMENTSISDALVNTMLEGIRRRWADFPHKHLDEIEFIDALPRNSAGKVQRQLLRQQTLTEFSYDC